MEFLARQKRHEKRKALTRGSRACNMQNQTRRTRPAVPVDPSHWMLENSQTYHRGSRVARVHLCAATEHQVRDLSAWNVYSPRKVLCRFPLCRRQRNCPSYAIGAYGILSTVNEKKTALDPIVTGTRILPKNLYRGKDFFVCLCFSCFSGSFSFTREPVSMCVANHKPQTLPQVLSAAYGEADE